jgi:hypothetical protein
VTRHPWAGRAFAVAVLAAGLLALDSGTSLAQRGGVAYRGGGGSAARGPAHTGGSGGVYYRGGGSAPRGPAYSGGVRSSPAPRVYSRWTGRTSSGVGIYQRPRYYRGYGYRGPGWYGGYYRHGYGYWPRTYIGFGLGWGVPYDDYYYPPPRTVYQPYPVRAADEVTNYPPAGCYYYDSYCDRTFRDLDDYTEHIERFEGDHPNTIQVVEKKTGDVLRTLEFVRGYWQVER